MVYHSYKNDDDFDNLIVKIENSFNKIYDDKGNYQNNLSYNYKNTTRCYSDSDSDTYEEEYYNLDSIKIKMINIRDNDIEKLNGEIVKLERELKITKSINRDLKIFFMLICIFFRLISKLNTV